MKLTDAPNEIHYLNDITIRDKYYGISLISGTAPLKNKYFISNILMCFDNNVEGAKGYEDSALRMEADLALFPLIEKTHRFVLEFSSTSGN